MDLVKMVSKGKLVDGRIDWGCKTMKKVSKSQLIDNRHPAKAKRQRLTWPLPSVWARSRNVSPLILFILEFEERRV